MESACTVEARRYFLCPIFYRCGERVNFVASDPRLGARDADCGYGFAGLIQNWSGDTARAEFGFLII
jgi:hypothetical protein